MKRKRPGITPNKLKEFRVLGGFTQQEVAEVLCLKDGQMVDLWEKGIECPDGNSLLKLLFLYKASERDLFGDYMKRTGRKLEGQLRKIRDKKS
jgi:transcriptional regulator with XRE-family HTH domain